MNEKRTIQLINLLNVSQQILHLLNARSLNPQVLLKDDGKLNGRGLEAIKRFRETDIEDALEQLDLSLKILGSEFSNPSRRLKALADHIENDLS